MTNILKSEKLNHVITILKTVYFAIFTVYLITREITVLNYFIDSLFITGFFFGMAALFIGYDLLTNRYCLKTRYLPAALLFLTITIISCVINLDYGIFSNIKGLAAFIIYLFLIYPEALKNKNNTVINTVGYSCFFTLSFYSVASMPMFFYNVYYYTAQNRWQGFIPGDHSRLWGLYQDCNYLALFCIIAILFSVLLFNKTKSIVLKVVFVLLDLLHLCIIALSGSRMGIICLAFSLFWISLIISFKKLKLNLLKRILVFVMLSVISITLPFVAVKGINIGLTAVKKAVLNNGSIETYVDVHKAYDKLYEIGQVEILVGLSDEIETDDYPFSETTKPVDRVENKDYANDGRIERWLDGLKLIAKKPFFGISPRNIFNFAKQLDTETLMGEKNYNIHSTYLEVLAGVGIIGGVFVLSFLILAAAYVFKAALGFTPSLKIIFSTTIVAIIAISAIFLPDLIFFQTTFAGLMFWLCLGNCLNTDHEGYKKYFTFRFLEKVFKKEINL